MHTNKRVRTSLHRSYINFQEWARDNNIYHQFINLESCIYGFTYRSRFGSYLIIINKNLTKELQKEVFLHEVEHILYDLPEQTYIIGVDMQYSALEKRADELARKANNL